MPLSHHAEAERTYRYEPPAWARLWDEPQIPFVAAPGEAEDTPANDVSLFCRVEDSACDELAMADPDVRRIETACLIMALLGLAMVVAQLARWAL